MKWLSFQDSLVLLKMVTFGTFLVVGHSITGSIIAAGVKTAYMKTYGTNGIFTFTSGIGLPTFYSG